MMHMQHTRSVRSRRDFVCISSLLPMVLAARTLGAREEKSETSASFGSAKACILLWLDGGPSHLEMWDPKDELPPEVRGPFRSIPTTVPGLRFSEGLQQSARHAHQMTILRSMSSPLGEHGLANHYMLTGYPPSSAVAYPSLGALVDRARDHGAASLPCYVAMPEIRTGMGAGGLGAIHEPFLVREHPTSRTLQARDLAPYPGLDAARLERRRSILRSLETQSLAHARTNAAKSGKPFSLFDDAFEVLESPYARSAFSLDEEDPATRDRYGARTFGQGCLLARRLVERGVPFVTVVQSGWDTHENLILHLRDGFQGAKPGVGLIPTFDTALGALLDDLEARNLLEETLVIAMGEFGRTPKLNARGGRDHWPRVFSIMLCGGGMPKGLVLGSSDRIGESPKDRPITPADLTHTLCHRLGIDPSASWTSPDGRPITINGNGQPIHELL